MIVYREATGDELGTLARLSTEAFGNYPFFDFVFSSAFKSEKAYFAYMEKLHRVHIRANMRRHKCFVGSENGRIVSTALLQAPDKRRIGVWDYIRAGALTLVFPVGLARILDFFDVSERAHSDCAREYPSAWYLEKLAVDASMKGRGLGSAMLNDCLLPYIRRQGGHELTLITNTELNCRFYAKNGFRMFAERMLDRGGQKIGNWSFRREA